MRRTVAALLLAAVVLTGCGDDGDGGAAPDPSASQATSGKPAVEIPAGPPPTALKVDDITVGTGEAAADGKLLTMQYVGVIYRDRREFDSSWGGAEPFQFTLGTDPVIQGWQLGIKGMKVGGRRRLIIPPDLAYGQQGQGDIGPNETLVFVVDLVAVNDPAGG